jgi:hypothetical protein
MARLEAKLRTAALAYSPLATLLGNGGNPNLFRWYETQLVEGSAFPAVVATLVSDPKDYCFTHRMSTSFTRMQFTIWDTDPSNASLVADTLANFLDQFNAYGISGLSVNANFIVNSRATIYPETQPPVFQRIVDAKIFNDDLVS